MKQDNAPVKAQSYRHDPRCSIVLFDLVPSCQVSRFQRPVKPSYWIAAVAPERIWKWGGAPVRSESGRRKKILVVPLHFLALKVGLQLVVLVSAYMMVNTLWSVSCSSAHGAPVPSHL